MDGRSGRGSRETLDRADTYLRDLAADYLDGWVVPPPDLDRIHALASAHLRRARSRRWVWAGMGFAAAAAACAIGSVGRGFLTGTTVHSAFRTYTYTTSFGAMEPNTAASSARLPATPVAGVRASPLGHAGSRLTAVSPGARSRLRTNTVQNGRSGPVGPFAIVLWHGRRYAVEERVRRLPSGANPIGSGALVTASPVYEPYVPKRAMVRSARIGRTSPSVPVRVYRLPGQAPLRVIVVTLPRVALPGSPVRPAGTWIADAESSPVGGGVLHTDGHGSKTP